VCAFHWSRLFFQMASLRNSFFQKISIFLKKNDLISFKNENVMVIKLALRPPLVAWNPGRIPAHSLALNSTGSISLGQTKSVFGVTRLLAQSAGEERAFAPGLVTSGRVSPTRLRFSSSPLRTRRHPLPPLLLPRAPVAACCLLSLVHRRSHRRLLISLVQPLLPPLHPCT
jgi:hypothetical protein